MLLSPGSLPIALYKLFIHLLFPRHRGPPEFDDVLEASARPRPYVKFDVDNGYGTSAGFLNTCLSIHYVFNSARMDKIKLKSVKLCSGSSNNNRLPRNQYHLLVTALHDDYPGWIVRFRIERCLEEITGQDNRQNKDEKILTSSAIPMTNSPPTNDSEYPTKDFLHAIWVPSTRLPSSGEGLEFDFPEDNPFYLYQFASLLAFLQDQSLPNTNYYSEAIFTFLADKADASVSLSELIKAAPNNIKTDFKDIIGLTMSDIENHFLPDGLKAQLAKLETKFLETVEINKMGKAILQSLREKVQILEDEHAAKLKSDEDAALTSIVETGLAISSPET